MVVFAIALVAINPTVNSVHADQSINKLTPVKVQKVAAQASAVAPSQAAPAPAPTAPVEAPAPVYPSGSHEDWMSQAGISSSDFTYVDYIVTHESGWNPLAWNSEGSGAYGICQAEPGSKMASAGSDWQTNPVTQLGWCNSYALSAYGGWANAYTHWVNNRWW